MKNIWIIANWKSNKTIADALDWISQVGPNLPKRDPSTSSGLKVVVCPTFSCLSEVKKAVHVGNFPMLVGSQDLSPFGVGAYTGEEPATLIKDFVEIAILGHSERRKNFGEDDKMVSEKVKQALDNNIIPLVCVQGSDTPVPQGCKLVAYEPIWAISTGLTNTPGAGRVDNPDDANKIAQIFKQRHGDGLEVIYGGSVDSTNVKGFVNQPNIVGVLVGNASLNAEEFIRILKECEG